MAFQRVVLVGSQQSLLDEVSNAIGEEFGLDVHDFSPHFKYVTSEKNSIITITNDYVAAAKALTSMKFIPDLILAVSDSDSDDVMGYYADYKIETHTVKADKSSQQIVNEVKEIFQSRSKIGSPQQFSRNFHLSFNSETGRYEGSPPDKWALIVRALKAQGLSEEEFTNNPLAARDALYSLNFEEILGEKTIEIGNPSSFQHHISIKIEDGKYVGYPKEAWEALQQKVRESGQDLQEDPLLARDVLYSLNAEDIFHVEVSKPSNVKHMMSISFNQETGLYEGEPKERWQKLLSALKEQGIDEETLAKDPMVAKNFLYSAELETLLKAETESKSNKQTKAKVLRRRGNVRESKVDEQQLNTSINYGLAIILAILAVLLLHALR